MIQKQQVIKISEFSNPAPVLPQCHNPRMLLLQLLLLTMGLSLLICKMGKGPLGLKF